jgi:hypothetical protein
MREKSSECRSGIAFSRLLVMSRRHPVPNAWLIRSAQTGATALLRRSRLPGNAIIIGADRHSAKEGRDIGASLPLTQNPIVNRRSAREGEQL